MEGIGESEPGVLISGESSLYWRTGNAEDIARLLRRVASEGASGGRRGRYPFANMGGLIGTASGIERLMDAVILQVTYMYY